MNKEKPNRFNVSPWIVIILIILVLDIFAGSYLRDFTRQKVENFVFGFKTYFGLVQEPDPLDLFKITGQAKPYSSQTEQEQAIINVVKKASPSVVNVVIFKEVPVYQTVYNEPFQEFQQFFGDQFNVEFKIPEQKQVGTEKKKIGSGTGFVISEDGLVLTNKHVVADQEAEFSIVSSDGKKHPAEVLARDPFQDLAVLQIVPDQEEVLDLKPVNLGNSDNLQIGQTVVAIGNALGEFRNTVSVGIISGLGRRITAQGGGIVETLEDVIQTDAGINKGNSGGPLLNLRGEVIGINVAIAEDAQSIGFSVPINKAKQAIVQVKTIGKIVYPFLGVRYVLLGPEIQQAENLSVDYGALIVRGDQGEPAIIPGSAASKAGLKEGDIILKLNNQRIDSDNSLAKIILKLNPGGKVVLEVLRKDQTLNIEVVLGEKSSE